jgi:hypothetical protein
MNDAIKSSIILTMAENLDLKELGVATRILARLIEKKGSIPLKSAHIVAGVGKEEWLEIQDSVLACFPHSETTIALGEIFLEIPAIATDAKPSRKGKTVPLFPATQDGHKPTSLPNYLAKRPKGVTIKQAIYDSGLRLFMAQNMSNLLSTYPAGEVAGAIEEAKAQQSLSDPHSWIVAFLRQKAQGTRVRVRPSSAPSSIESVNTSADTAPTSMTTTTKDAIIKRNAGLTGVRLGLFEAPKKKIATENSDETNQH